ncbi:MULTISPECIES: polyphosphate:AMP phosphotransferase [unclassified Oceanobacter]|jgi:polyphosphate:AMP phosphotransferase|uniref:polyphosphate:AMP phosphotransferase n=1 Tax=unclassified Oceanobacter TaxID=2620260 RepID=UPI0026E245DD|nr:MULTISPECIES: polyphosphate:AMP phosphotransferase [unclassified Oceanobacter]MDO6683541.1 polyphosphate:AMP phosphotransferase [Oceanobacter sp. 5_MG-2023]MDP2504776.1 polyphosphate:AMP phosphotransferase [Oceanobacter sp. 3_MG-2023]MDP2546219.1 polyphosphate:AMP phosphotransferase [Oceanobacter sp. 4_MG-2023]MDP2607521.1 polyphosphate:AMP phosphotransferase [Oceanobacter sp. 1_MG-2023]MDP2610789.1 polyphosphate:AMP phosphotransferase [Oceanobacter sp. 2_MG-2023]
MFEVAELGQALSREEFDKRVPELRTQLLEMQRTLSQADFPVIVLVSGSDGAGKGVLVNRLNEWLDPRYLRTLAFDDKTQDERERPDYWRFWQALPQKGRIGLYIGSWYSDPIALRVDKTLNDIELDGYLAHIRIFERMLVEDGALVIKLWLHLSKDQQQLRLQQLASDPATAWRVTEKDKLHLALYDDFRSTAEHTLRQTSTAEAPWVVIESADPNYRDITVANHLLERIQQHLTLHAHSDAAQDDENSETVALIHRQKTLLGNLDMDQSLDKSTYRQKLEHWQGKLSLLARRAYEQQVSMVIVLEGWDAAGKGGLIRRIVPALDARNYQIIPIAAPTDEENAHHYLWRFWRHIPRDGRVTMYDRSWYGRVLVERVEGLASRSEWLRAYSEINDFESQLVEHGTVVVKFWLHIDADEQLKRFKERETISYKRHKITDEDYRNRERWVDYEQAVNDMVERTSTEVAPWHLIEANSKRFARIKALKILCQQLEQRLGVKGKGKE